MKKIHAQVPGTDRTLCGKKVTDNILLGTSVNKGDSEFCESCTDLGHPDSKPGEDIIVISGLPTFHVTAPEAHVEGGTPGRSLCGIPMPDKPGDPGPPCYTCTILSRTVVQKVPAPRKGLSKHDLEIVKRSVKTAMSGGFRQVYLWAGPGFREHWAESIALGIATNREGVVDTDWLHQLKLAVYEELGLSTVDVATPSRISDLTRSKP